MIIPPYKIEEWKGLNTAVKDNRSLDRGETYSALNWITGRKGDHIELRRGQALLGTTNREPTTSKSKVTGLGVGTRIDGVEIPFFSTGRSIYYYDINDTDTHETATVNVLPDAADGEDINFNPYTNLAGSFEYVTSPHAGHFKIPTANPAYPVDQNVTTYGFGFAKINRSRMYGMARQGPTSTSFDATGIYLSWVDKENFSDYPAQQVNKPQASGNGVMKTFTGSALTGATSPGVITYFSIIFGAPIQAGTSISAITKASNAVITAAGNGLVAGDMVMVLAVVGMTEINGIITSVVSVSGNNVTVDIDSTAFTAWSSAGSIYKIEAFSDDRSGNLNSNLGGTGTINYATGAWALTFNTAPINLANCIIANLNYENATDEGILDFSYNSATRVPATGNSFRQDDGGGVGQAIWPYQSVEYCFHVLKSWLLTALDSTDTATTNLPYYEQIGIPYHRAVFPTSSGIIFLNNVNPADPKVSMLTIPPGSTNLTVVPLTLSQDLDLTGFAYDFGVVKRWGEFDVMCCQNYRNGQVDAYNSTMFIRNIYSGHWNQLDYRATCLDSYYGSLLAGDSISPNVYTLFSGFDDDGEVIDNYWKSSYKDLDLSGLKKVNYLGVEGLIQHDQQLEVYISLDQGAYTLAFTIDGDGSYVSAANPVGVGSFTSGLSIVGGGGGAVTANPFEVDIPIHTDRFEYISFMIKAIGVGYVQVDTVQYKDIRFKRRRLQSYNDPEID